MKWYSFNRIVTIGLLQSLQNTRPYVTGMLLDVGCGTKPYADLFTGQVSTHIGIDLPVVLSPNKQAKQADSFVDLRCALPLGDNSFDSVLCTEVLEHHPEPDFLVLEMARVLKPGGYLVLTAPQVWGLHEVPYDYYRYTRYGLAFLAQKAGLEVLYIEPRGGLWSMLAQRLSSYFHYRFSEGKSIYHKVVVTPVCLGVQVCGLLLDRLLPYTNDTLGNTMVARKSILPEQ